MKRRYWKKVEKMKMRNEGIKKGVHNYFGKIFEEKPEELKEGFKKLEMEVADEVKKHYKTICPHCLRRCAKIYNKNPEEVVNEIVEKLRNADDPRKVYREYSFKGNIREK